MPSLSSPSRRLPSLATLMFLAMGFGAGLGALLGERAAAGAFLGDIFIRLLILAAVPLLFLNLVSALGSAGAGGKVSAVAWRFGAYAVLTTAGAGLAGFALVSLFEPGVGMASVLGGSSASSDAPPAAFDGLEFLRGLAPESVFGVFVERRVAAVVVLALLLGAALRTLEEGSRGEILRFVTAATALFRRLTEGVLWFGPIGVAALAAQAVGEYGSAVFGPLGRYIGAIWAADLALLLAHLALVRILARRPAIEFLRRTSTAWMTAVTTCSSLASLSASLETAGRIGLPRSVYSFTLPLGAQLNKDGSAVMLGGMFLFTVQALGGDFGFGDLAAALALAVLVTLALPGVANGGVVGQMLLVGAFGFPPSLVLLVAGVYRLVDMPMTALNIFGDLVGTTVVAKRLRRAE